MVTELGLLFRVRARVRVKVTQLGLLSGLGLLRVRVRVFELGLLLRVRVTA